MTDTNYTNLYEIRYARHELHEKEMNNTHDVFQLFIRDN